MGWETLGVQLATLGQMVEVCPGCLMRNSA